MHWMFAFWGMCSVREVVNSEAVLKSSYKKTFLQYMHEKRGFFSVKQAERCRFSIGRKNLVTGEAAQNGQSSPQCDWQVSPLQGSTFQPFSRILFSDQKNDNVLHIDSIIRVFWACVVENMLYTTGGRYVLSHAIFAEFVLCQEAPVDRCKHRAQQKALASINITFFNHCVCAFRCKITL